MYTSPHSVCPSHATTVLRKLSTIRPTPMVTETATISAAIATVVRLSAPATLRGAMRPSTPASRLPTGTATCITAHVNAGASSAKPMVNRKMPAKLITRSRVGTASRPVPPRMPASPTAVMAGSARRALSSSPERVSASRGETVAASHAGRAVDATVAATPSRKPLSRLPASMARPRTVTTK